MVFESLAASLRGYTHILLTLVTNWQYLGAIALGALIGALARRKDGRIPRPDHRAPLVLAFGVLALLFSGYVCTVITRPVFGSSVVTVNRLWNDYLFLLLLLLVGAGGLLGNWAVRRYRRGTGPVVAGATLLCVGVTVVLAVALRDLGSDMQARGKAWDRQDRLLRKEAAAGVSVLSYEPLVISKMTEPFGNKGKRSWPAACVATYYHVKDITDGTRTGTQR
ncbi:hypothetical protein AB0O68_29850 [Streptomyces sp. NPDC087512]|uniref:hypothetical protein n=1 Tax=Streptomyces sp. NPDC087512 TaxID=3155059 RepID=UPI0034377A6F